MNDFEAEVKATYEALAGRAMTEIEVEEIALALRQFAAFLMECGRDEALCATLGSGAPEASTAEAPEPRAAPRAVESTTQNDRKPLGVRLPAESLPPTGAPSRDALPHRDPSASHVSASPAGQPATPQPIQRVTTGATVDGSL